MPRLYVLFLHNLQTVKLTLSTSVNLTKFSFKSKNIFLMFVSNASLRGLILNFALKHILAIQKLYVLFFHNLQTVKLTSVIVKKSHYNI
jgi:hypothetical protein